MIFLKEKHKIKIEEVSNNQTVTHTVINTYAAIS